MPFQPNPDYWTACPKDDGTVLYTCRICNDHRERTSKHARQHEPTDVHQEALRTQSRQVSPSAGNHPTDDNNLFPDSAPPPSSSPEITTNVIVEDAVRSLILSLSGNQGSGPQVLYPADHPLVPPSANPLQTAPSPVTNINWGALRATGGLILENSPLQDAVDGVAQATMDFLNDNIHDVDLSDDEAFEHSSAGGNGEDEEHEQLDEDEDNFGNSSDSDEGHPAQKRARHYQPDAETQRQWFPWIDKITCTLDILMHLPRSVFSERQLNLLLYLLKVQGVQHVPSVRSMKTLNKMLQTMCGIDTIPYIGVQGNRYHVNNLAQILAQELANPFVREHLSFYPEDSRDCLDEARQARKWLHEMPSDQTTPMIRLGQDDYYIYEPTMLKDHTVCIPHRWFTRDGAFYGWAWKLEPRKNHDGVDGWLVRQDQSFELSQSDLMKNLPSLNCDWRLYGLPSPSAIHAVLTSDHCFKDWTLTNLKDEMGLNPWRQRANGRRVVALPLWLYCDDTSGNVSKKWNEHNSYLFTLAGLSREQVSKEYNVHFLCTSNLAAPIEMMDGVVEQVRDAQSKGIWAWDCHFQEPVLGFPSVLALLGDNPMQSEFSCHIGMRGKFFCRICKVKGKDADAMDIIHPMQGLDASGSYESSGLQPENEDSDGSQQASADDDSSAAESDTAGPAPKTKKATRKRGTKTESSTETIARVTRFMKAGEPRTAQNTLVTLKNFRTEAEQLHSKSRLKKMHTETGIKDSYQEYFFEKLFKATDSTKGSHEKKAALDRAVSDLPVRITSPVWEIPGLDPHQDTPVEILHVGLLGFVKYFWRDLVNQLKGKDDKKQLLMHRLSALDVSGLGISRLNGKTLVQYAGSLTGRDFRALAQCAPFCIHDLVSPPCFAAWQAMSSLVPLIWQPEIKNLNDHIKLLEKHIEHFLVKTAQWNYQWFNKPKFHILVHLPNHIRRFGPAILFATESFESFNAVIRAKSVHSNRQAPSRDIGLAFAQGNRIRHILSGGYFKCSSVDTPSSGLDHQTASRVMESYGPGPRNLASGDNTLTSFLGLASLHRSQTKSRCLSDKRRLRPLSECETGKKIPQSIQTFGTNSTFKSNLSFTSESGDKCAIDQFVLFCTSPSSPPILGIIREILQQVGSRAELEQRPSGILIQKAHVNQYSAQFGLPELAPLERWHFISPKNICCTVNAQHNCARHGCGLTGRRQVIQERVLTGQETAALKHQGNLDDVLLNVFQMRSSSMITPFRQSLSYINIDTEVHEAVMKQSDAGKVPTGNRVAALVASSRGRGRGRGIRVASPLASSSNAAE